MPRQSRIRKNPATYLATAKEIRQGCDELITVHAEPETKHIVLADYIDIELARISYRQAWYLAWWIIKRLIHYGVFYQ